tara:strand:- start:35770 stop:36267 length:498 start_codon:yes stop_codon:yes gene_type:complete
MSDKPPTSVGNLEVSHHDNVLRWRVHSRTRPDVEHIVDISANNGIGECSCEHFQFKLRPAIEQGLASNGMSVRCAHIMAARHAFADDMIGRLTTTADEIEADQATAPEPEHQDDPMASGPRRTWECPDCRWCASALSAPAAREAMNKHPDSDGHCDHLNVQEKTP